MDTNFRKFLIEGKHPTSRKKLSIDFGYIATGDSSAYINAREGGIRNGRELTLSEIKKLNVDVLSKVATAVELGADISGTPSDFETKAHSKINEFASSTGKKKGRVYNQLIKLFRIEGEDTEKLIDKLDTFLSKYQEVYDRLESKRENFDPMMIPQLNRMRTKYMNTHAVRFTHLSKEMIKGIREICWNGVELGNDVIDVNLVDMENIHPNYYKNDIKSVRRARLKAKKLLGMR